MGIVEYQNPDDAMRFELSPGYVGIPFGDGVENIVWVESDSSVGRFWSLLCFLWWVAHGAHIVRVASVDAERGIITFESVL